MWPLMTTHGEIRMPRQRRVTKSSDRQSDLVDELKGVAWDNLDEDGISAQVGRRPPCSDELAGDVGDTLA